MRLFMIQLRLNDWPGSMYWYVNVLGLKVILHDEEGEFVLLDAGAAKLALKARKANEPATPSNASIVFEVEDLEGERDWLRRQGVDVGPIVENQAERFRESRFADPEGNAIAIFMWNHPK